jgi:hypothetical protein
VQGEGAGTEALHGEGEVGEARMARQRLAQQADGARVDDVEAAAAVGAADGVAQPAGRAEAGYQVAAGGIDVAMMAGDVFRRPVFRSRSTCALLKEWPVEIFCRSWFHHRSKAAASPRAASMACFLWRVKIGPSLRVSPQAA